MPGSWQTQKRERFRNFRSCGGTGIQGAGKAGDEGQETLSRHLLHPWLEGDARHTDHSDEEAPQENTPGAEGPFKACDRRGCAGVC